MELTSEHEQLSLLISKQLIGDINADEQQAINAWRSRNPHNEQVYQRLRADGMSRAAAQLDQPADYRPSLERVKQALDHGQRRSPRLRRWAIAAAVAVVVAAGGLTWWQRYTRVVPPTISEAVQTAMAQSRESGREEADIKAITQQEVQTVLRGLTRRSAQSDKEIVEDLLEAKRITTWQDKEYWLTLSDGTCVHLNYNTRVIYPERFTGDCRDIILDGEAYFMVATDKRHPFVVHTPQGSIRAYGTEFNVNTRSQAEQTEVVLVEGSVGVTPAEGAEQPMQPGQKCVLTGSQCTLEQTDVAPYVAWNTGELMFTDTPLEVLLSTVGHWYHIDVEYANPSARELLFTGTIDRYGRASAILRSIGKVTGLSIEQHGDHVTIK